MLTESHMHVIIVIFRVCKLIISILRNLYFIIFSWRFINFFKITKFPLFCCIIFRYVQILTHHHCLIVTLWLNFTGNSWTKSSNNIVFIIIFSSFFLKLRICWFSCLIKQITRHIHITCCILIFWSYFHYSFISILPWFLPKIILNIIKCYYCHVCCVLIWLFHVDKASVVIKWIIGASVKYSRLSMIRSALHLSLLLNISIFRAFLHRGLLLLIRIIILISVRPRRTIRKHRFFVSSRIIIHHIVFL